MVLLAAGLLAPLCAACSFTVPGKEIVSTEQVLHAYGKTWKLVTTHRFDTEYYFFGITGGGTERTKEFLYLDKQDGSRINLNERVYALQRDGSYKKVENCCGSYGPTGQPLLDFDDKLFFNLLAKNDQITDCFVHPAYAPDNDQRPPDKRLTIIDFWGEFDPVSERVLLNQFFPGADEKAEQRPTSRTMREHYQFLYAHRRPFGCKGTP